MTSFLKIKPRSFIPGNYGIFYIRAFVFFLLCFPCFINSYSQSKIQIQKPLLTLVEGNLIINYNFSGIQQKDKFNVWVQIANMDGGTIIPQNIRGDIGDSVGGSSMKQIIWDYAADGVNQDMNISVAVLAEMIKAPEPVLAEKKVFENTNPAKDEIIASERKTITPESKTKVTESKAKVPENKPVSIDNTEEKVNKEKKTPVASAAMRNNLIYSAVLPGWGLSRMYDNKAYMLIGLGGIGCIASSFYLNGKAHSNYTNYLNSFDADKVSSYFDTGKSQYTTSRVLAWSAVAIWVADLGIVWLKSAKMNTPLSKNSRASFSVGPSFSGNLNAPIICCFYNF